MEVLDGILPMALRQADRAASMRWKDSEGTLSPWYSASFLPARLCTVTVTYVL